MRVRNLVLAFVVVAAGCTGADAAAPDPTPPTEAPPSSGLATTIAPTTTEATTTTLAEATTTTVPVVPIAKTLAKSAEGDDVARVQQRLKDLHFDPGPVDGKFGTTTVQAVWAFQKLTGAEPTGKVTPELWLAMNQPFAPAPLEEGLEPTHLEVDLVKQVAVLYTDGQPTLITHVSTGTGTAYCEKGVCSKAVTPGGSYKFTWRFKGWRESTLGKLYNPVYFNGGIAVHGALEVPSRPASHGCIRIPMHIAEYFPGLVHQGDRVYVFDGKKSPKAYGAQPPPPNTKDPTWTGTTLAPDVPPSGATTTAPGAATSAGATTTRAATTTVATTTTTGATTTPATTTPASTTPAGTTAP